MPTLVERIDAACWDFRCYHLAPAGGWLAGLVIPLARITGVWDFTWLFYITLWSCIFLRRTTCEFAIMFGLFFDLCIPFVHWRTGVHLKQCAEYFPKRLIAFALELIFYVVLDADTFNWYVAANTVLMMYLWLSPRYPRYIPPSERKGGSGDGSDASRRSTSGDPSKPNPLVTPEYLQYLKSKFDPMVAKDSKYKEPTDKLMKRVQQPMGSSDYKKAIDGLKRQQIRTPEQWHEGNGSNAASGSGSGAGSDQAGGASGSSPSPPVDPSSLPAPPPGPAYKACVANNIDPTGTLSKEKAAELDEKIGSLVQGGKRMGSTEQAKWKRGIRQPFGADMYQYYAKQLKNIFKDLEGVEGVAPHYADPVEVQYVLDQAKGKGVAEQQLKEMRSALEGGPEANAEKWDETRRKCKYELGLEMPEWFDPPDQPFITGYKIPWTNQLRYMPIIKDKVEDKKLVRGYIYRLNDYFIGTSDIEAALAEINYAAGLNLTKETVAQKTRYYNLKVKDHDGDVFVTASHYKEGAFRARFDDPQGGLQDYQKAWAQYKYLKDKNDLKNMPDAARTVLSFCTLGQWFCRTEDYTDYVGGSLGYSMPYLRGLREKWMKDGDFGGFKPVDELLFQIKNAPSKEKSQELINMADAICNGTASPQERKDNTEHIRRLDHAAQVEFHFQLNRAKIFGDTFSPAGGGMSTDRIIKNPEWP